MAYGDTWTLRLDGIPQAEWGGFAASSDGQIVYAGNGSVTIQNDLCMIKSTDYGVTWSGNIADIGVFNDNIENICCSADGSKIYAATPTSFIYRSLDSGATWDQVNNNIPDTTFANICCSSDGQKVFAVNIDNDIVYYSVDYGETWSYYANVPVSGSNGWYGNACSADGTKLMLAYPILAVTLDSGANWFTKTTAAFDGKKPIALACNDDFSILYAGTNDGGIYKSIDQGATWVSIYAAATNWWRMSTDSTGNKIIAINFDSYIAVSDDAGATWSQRIPTVTPTGVFYAAGMSRDGGLLIVGTSDSELYTADGVELTVNSITPNTGSALGGTPVFVAGTGFRSTATAAIAGNALTDVTVVDSTTLTGITPAGTLGSKDVTVTNP